MDYNKKQIALLLNDVILSPQLSLEIARLLLDCVFVSWNKPDNIVEENHIRRFLIVDFYQILLEMQSEYLEETHDYSKNANEHLSLQNKIKKITAICISLQNKDYHDEIVYLMNILA
jgi:hypothetical protein